MDSTPAYRARCAILGSMVGDALGTTLEFCKGDEAREILKKYSNFKDGLVGGGPFNVVPGQFTDDTELGLANMVVMINNGKYDQNLAAQSYHQWFKSKPFDIGTTTRNALCHKSAKEMMDAAKNINYSSMSNGFLMRLPGLIALHHDKKPEYLVQAVKLDTMLTHGNPEAQHISVIYAAMLDAAIQGKSAKVVYDLGKELANSPWSSTENYATDYLAYGKFFKYSPLVSSIYQCVESDADDFKYNGVDYALDSMDGPNQGFVGYALWWLIWCLSHHASYEEAMLAICRSGGDCDTNNCIVGAVMAALYPSTIPQKWIDSVMNFSNKKRFDNYPIANPAVWSKWLP